MNGQITDPEIRGDINGHSVDLVELPDLVPTEKHSQERAAKLSFVIQSTGTWTVPVLCWRNANAVLDGHHRCAAAAALKLRKVPVVFVSEDDPRVGLSAWRQGETVTFDLIAEVVKSGSLLPFKTTRFRISGGVPLTSVPLDRLL